MVEEDYYKLYSCVCIVFGLAQAAWRRLAPDHYFRMRVWVVLFNRTIRLSIFVVSIWIARASLAHAPNLAAQQRAYYHMGPLRATLWGSYVFQAFGHACNTILPFRLQAAFQLVYLGLSLSVYGPCAMLVLDSAGKTPLKPPPHLTPAFPPLTHAPFCPAVPPSSPAPAAHYPPTHLPAHGMCLTSDACSYHFTQLQFHRSIKALCTDLATAMQLARLTAGVWALLVNGDQCDDHSIAIFVVFLNILLVLLLPIFIAYRIEQHAKALYVRDVILAADALAPDGDDEDADYVDFIAVKAPCLPYWTDLAILALLAAFSWEAAFALHRHAIGLSQPL